MPLSLDPSLLLIPLIGVVVALGLWGPGLVARLRGDSLTYADDFGEHRRCCYCHKDEAQLCEESMMVEGHDLVETRLYACSHCGFPQWIVTRTPVVQSTR